MCKSLVNGDLVPNATRCAFCGRNPRQGERFGTDKKSWEVVGMICPDCWMGKLPPEPED